MLDIKFIRENKESVAQKSKEKGSKVDIDAVLALDEERRQIVTEFDKLQEERNRLAKEMGQGGKPSPEVLAKGKELKQTVAEVEKKLQDVEARFSTLLKQVPNMPTEDTPVGASEDDNKLEYVWGEKPVFDFPVKNHAEIATARGWIDKERAGKVTGARFAYLKGDIVRLQFALIQFIFDTLGSEDKIKEIAAQFNVGDVSTKPFTPILPPLLLKTDMYDAMDRLEPRDDRYKIEGEDLWLQGSAEHVLGSMHRGETFAETELPVRYIGYATSFRKEAGTYGKDMEGIIRMHQFDKLEMESFSAPEAALKEHFLFVAIQEYLLRALELPYRKLLKCTYDIGKPNARGVDMEVWLPGQEKYRETHTADYMTDYQARRLDTRFKSATGKTGLIHTNDATALALGRGMVAIMENYQTTDAHVRVPSVLVPYLKTEIL